MDALQVVAEPKRRKILSLVWNDELSATEIAGNFDVTFAAISQHLGVLREAGFVTMQKEGNRRLYQANKEALGPLRAVLENMWADTLDQLTNVIEQDMHGRANG